MEEYIRESLDEPVGKLWIQFQHAYGKLGNFHVASPLTSTPLPIYRWIIDHANEYPNWDRVNFVLMDEMLEGTQGNFSYVPVTDTASYEGFAQRNLLEPVGEKAGQKIKVLKPDINSMHEFKPEIHLLILALGIAGNYANVMPGTPEKTGWHIAHLSPEFRQVHTESGSSSYAGADFRQYGMSLGPEQVLAAENVIVIAGGEKKRELVKQLRSLKNFTPDFPISIIYHPKVADRVQLYFTPDCIS